MGELGVLRFFALGTAATSLFVLEAALIYSVNGWAVRRFGRDRRKNPDRRDGERRNAYHFGRDRRIESKPREEWFGHADLEEFTYERRIDQRRRTERRRRIRRQADRDHLRQRKQLPVQRTA